MGIQWHVSLIGRKAHFIQLHLYRPNTKGVPLSFVFSLSCSLSAVGPTQQFRKGHISVMSVFPGLSRKLSR